ncbi:MAG TPA: ABC transporter permease [Clostridiaceae bacterium]|nr:ABC transporter permease [Clostridiaceae bacterium]
MQVFKLCLKILKKKIPSMLIYLVIFLVVSLIISHSTSAEQQKHSIFSQKKTNITFISEEKTPLIDGLRQELGKIANFVSLPDEKEALSDALFFRWVTYIVRVPKGFTESFMKGENARLEKITVPNSISNTYVDLCIDKYFNIARLYVQQLKDISQESLVKHLEADLSIYSTVELKTKNGKPANHAYANYYFNYLAYSLLAVLILGISAIILTFYNNDLRKRNACSPLSANNINLQFILAILVFSVSAWIIMVIFCLAVNINNSLNLNTFYFIINSFVFTICGTSISYLIGNLVKSPGAVPAVSNVVTLGLCFISGVFVPAELLGSSVLKIASFAPTYWFVKANDQIAGLTEFNFHNIKPVLSAMIIQLCFSLAFFTVALVINKKRRFE